MAATTTATTATATATGTLSASNSFRFNNNESSQSLLSRPGSIFGSRLSLSDDTAVYMSSVALTIGISAIVVIGIILAAITATLSIMLVECQNGSQMGLHFRASNNSNPCLSFRLNAELDNLQGWVLPKDCERHVEAYMNGGQYENDVAIALSGARAYLMNVNPKDDGRDVVVMDIDDTALSNLPYYQKHHYGAEDLNENLWNEWVNESNAPAVNPVLEFYRDIQSAQWNIIFITERPEHQRNETVKNLLFAGYKNWLILVLRSENEHGLSAKLHKSNKRVQLEREGYRIWSTFGDQWSDILGSATGNRTFKLPNPMYCSY